MSEAIRPEAASEAPWTANDGTFAARLALIRQRMNWNVKEAALACGIPPQSWRTWESGAMPQGRMYFARCEQIAQVTGCDYGWLVDRRPSGSVKVTGPYVRRLLLLDGKKTAQSGKRTATQSPLISTVKPELTR